MRLENKRVIVTGGARGIGHAIADRFLREGAQVLVLDKKAEELNTRLHEWTSRGLAVHAIPVDLESLPALETAAYQAIRQLNGADILINNAGIAIREPFLEISQHHWETVLNVNLHAMFRLSQIVSKAMVSQGKGGSIVNMASKNGLFSSAKLAHYNASKGGVILLTQSMAVELAAYNIRVNAVAPGFIKTPLAEELKQKEAVSQLAFTRTPMGREGTVEEVANAFLFLASDEASYITGTTLLVDGGHLANAGEI